jgi:flagellar hook-associated protein 3 FlgL
MPAGRITQQSIADAALRGLQSSLTRSQRLQEQLSSGKRVGQASDDPSATASSMTLRSRRAANDQFLRNLDMANGRVGVTDNALTQLSDRLRAARELLIQSRNGALGGPSLAGIAANIAAVRSEVVDIYNTSYLDRPIFGGTIQGLSALDANANYIGDDAPIALRISGDALIRVDVTGRSVGADTVPAMLDQLATNVANGVPVTATDLSQLDVALSQVASVLGDIGARSARVSQTRDAVDSQRLDLTSRISLNEDIDMPETIMNLSAQQVGYQAALQSAAKIQQISLVDFLK